MAAVDVAGGVKLLFDENLSPARVRLTADLFPGSGHVAALLGDGATDTLVWATARRDGYAIVSKDNDFRRRSFTDVDPPKVVWQFVGNAGTAVIARLLRDRVAELSAFAADATVSLLIVGLTP